MLNWIWGQRIADGIDKGNEIAEKQVKVTARSVAADLKANKELTREEANKAWEESNAKVKEANRLADRTYMMRIVHEAPHPKKVKEYYKKKWDEISAQHTKLIKEWNELKQIAKDKDEIADEAHENWHSYKTRYGLWGDGSC